MDGVENEEPCWYQTKNGYCGYYELPEKELMNVFDKLGKLEDEEERREKGCDHCHKPCINCEHYDEEFDDCNERWYVEAAYTMGCDYLLFYENERYCKHCGRQLKRVKK